MSGRIVIACYRPKPGKEKALEELSKTHVERLKNEGLVTERMPIVMRANEGTIVEVFEWKSKEAIEKAHENPVVQKMWGEYAEVCEYVQPISIDEFQNLFSEFEPIN
ncbi:antibiotic biosynthesis monooxygenase [Ekhidna sp. To15]|uniref:antibiotic biosynthesis monooxygenase n=1 Tax=Ekhidna sp. To15 TaxID=3395267 RepID=UPI003F523F58